MQIQPPEHEEEFDPILPMINVVFLLLIFFMLAGALHAVDTFEVTPPTSVSETDVEDQEGLVLIGADGRLAVKGELVDETDLQLAVSDMLAERPETLIRLKADNRVDAVRVVEDMELLEAVGVERLILLTLEPER